MGSRRHIPTVKPVEMDYARLAAYIDGEGSILITERHYEGKQYQGMYLRLVLANTDPRLPIWCRERFGGVFVVADRRRSPKHRLAYKWHVSCAQAAELIEKCLPYFVVKREQAEVAIAFQKTVRFRGRGRALTDDEKAIRASCKEELHRLRWQVIKPAVNS